MGEQGLLELFGVLTRPDFVESRWRGRSNVRASSLFPLAPLAVIPAVRLTYRPFVSVFQSPRNPSKQRAFWASIGPAIASVCPGRKRMSLRQPRGGCSCQCKAAARKTNAGPNMTLKDTEAFLNTLMMLSLSPTAAAWARSQTLVLSRKGTPRASALRSAGKYSRFESTVAVVNLLSSFINITLLFLLARPSRYSAGVQSDDLLWRAILPMHAASRGI